MTRKQLEKLYDKKFAQAGDTNEDFEEFLIEEITLLKDKLKETHTCCINYANKLNTAKDKIKRRNKQIKQLKTDNEILRMKINAWEEKYGEIEDLTEQF